MRQYSLSEFEKGLVSVIIPSYGRPLQLKRCIDSVLASDYQKIEIIVVDSPRGGIYASDSLNRDYPKSVRIIKMPRRAFTSAARNIGLFESRGEYVFFLDHDNILLADTISKLVETLEKNSEIGTVGPLALYATAPYLIWSTGSYKSRFFRLHKGYDAGLTKIRIYDADIIPNAFMVKRKVFQLVGPLDSVNFTFQEDETEFQLRCRSAGYRTVIRSDAITLHDIEQSLVAHFSPEMLYHAFKARFWIEKKHQIRNILGFFLACAALVPWYVVILSVNAKKHKLNIMECVQSMLAGIVEGLFKNPKPATVKEIVERDVGFTKH